MSVMQRNLLPLVAASALGLLLGCSDAEIEPTSAVLRGEIVELGPQPEEPIAAAPTEPIAAIGGPCLGTLRDEADAIRYGELTSAASRAEREQDYVAAVDLAKQVVRAGCFNSYWWRKLAELQLHIERPADAVAALAAYHDRGGNDVDAWLQDPEGSLRVLSEMDAYVESALARDLAGERAAADQRRGEAIRNLASMSKPAENYTAQDACPGECCMFGEWTALDPNTLYRAPESAEAVGDIAAGQTVDALGGQMRLRPTPVLVRFAGIDGLTANEGDIVFLLDYQGESFGHIWVNGQVQSASWFGAREICPFPNQECWGEVLRPEDAGEWNNGVWWVQIRTNEGTTGWTSQTNRFTGGDACS